MTPPPRWPNLVIRASAGTGKTYQLSNRYLQLAADGQPADQVLASTFARKAAGEILGRVLVRLAGAVVDAAARAELARAIGREPERRGLPAAARQTDRRFASLADRHAGQLFRAGGRAFYARARIARRLADPR